MAIWQVHRNLITIPVCVNDSTIEALIDSGALHIVASKLLIQRIQWQISSMNYLVVQTADCSKAFSTVTCSVQLQIGVLTSIETFYILDSSLDMVLRMPWL